MLLLLLACAPASPCDSPHTCPEAQTFNCQPVVAPEREELCSGECRAWIQDNCPDVAYVD